jgi:hypothetical protein
MPSAQHDPGRRTRCDQHTCHNCHGSSPLCAMKGGRALGGGACSEMSSRSRGFALHPSSMAEEVDLFKRWIVFGVLDMVGWCLIPLVGTCHQPLAVALLHCRPHSRLALPLAAIRVLCTMRQMCRAEEGHPGHVQLLDSLSHQLIPWYRRVIVHA